MSEKDLNPDLEDKLFELRNAAGLAIQRHFNLHPEGVMIASVKDGRIMVDCTNFGDIGLLCFTKQLLDKSFSQSLESFILGAKTEAEGQAKND
jgi:hypothetical protein